MLSEKFPVWDSIVVKSHSKLKTSQKVELVTLRSEYVARKTVLHENYLKNQEQLKQEYTIKRRIIKQKFKRK